MLFPLPVTDPADPFVTWSLVSGVPCSPTPTLPSPASTRRYEPSVSFQKPRLPGGAAAPVPVEMMSHFSPLVAAELSIDSVGPTTLPVRPEMRTLVLAQSEFAKCAIAELLIDVVPNPTDPLSSITNGV